MHVAIAGAGLMGLITAYRLAKTGYQVGVYEASGQLGGLASDVEVAGVRVDRFYHCILNADDDLIELITEVGLGESLRMHPVRAGFLADGTIHPISTPLDLLRFPPLSLRDRLRLIRSLLACRRITEWKQLEQVDVETWLRTRSGDEVFERVWRPLLSAKFDGNFSQTPATYIWSRTVRMSDTRTSGGRRELSGHLVGGYQTLCQRLGERITELGGEIHLNCPIEGIGTRQGAVTDIAVRGGTVPIDALVLTTPLPITGRLLATRRSDGLEGDERRAAIDAYVRQVQAVDGYLGVICLLLMIRRRLTPNYTLYLADETLPFTAIIETTNIIDPSLVGNRHLVYLPKYVDPESPIFGLPDDQIRHWFLGELRRVFPDLRDEEIIAAPVFRAPHVEPLHPMGSLDTIPDTRTPIDGIWIGSTKHFYPRLNNGNSVTWLASELSNQVASWHQSNTGQNMQASVEQAGPVLVAGTTGPHAS